MKASQVRGDTRPRTRNTPATLVIAGGGNHHRYPRMQGGVNPTSGPGHEVTGSAPAGDPVTSPAASGSPRPGGQRPGGQRPGGGPSGPAGGGWPTAEATTG